MNQTRAPRFAGLTADTWAWLGVAALFLVSTLTLVSSATWAVATGVSTSAAGVLMAFYANRVSRRYWSRGRR